MKLSENPVAFLGFVGLLLAGSLAAGPLINRAQAPHSGPAPRADAVAAAPAGVERYACEQATKMQLRDPDSYQKIEFRPIDSTQASLTFRARNGFGGYDTGAAACTVEGTGVRSVLLPL